MHNTSIKHVRLNIFNKEVMVDMFHALKQRIAHIRGRLSVLLLLSRIKVPSLEVQVKLSLDQKHISPGISKYIYKYIYELSSHWRCVQVCLSEIK